MNELAEQTDELDLSNLDQLEIIDDSAEPETEPDEAEEVVEEGVEQESEAEETTEEVETEEEEEVLLIDGEEVTPASEEQQAPSWVKNLRKQNRDLHRMLKAAEAQIQTQAPEEIQVGERPKLEDFDYDEDAFNDAYDAWSGRKRAAEAKKKEAEEAQERAQQEWQDKLTNYEQRKEAFSSKRLDYDEAEELVNSRVDDVAKQLLIMSPEPERLIYVLGKQESKLNQLTEAKTPLEQAFVLGQIHSSIKTEKRPATKAKPQKKLGGAGGSITRSALQREYDTLAGSGKADAQTISKMRQIKKALRNKVK
jgi:hypothetical protein